MNRPAISALVFLAVAAPAPPVAAQTRGEAPAVAAAERLLDAVGGREAWANARTFFVEERVFTASGDVAQLRIWRDMVAGTRRLERSSAGSTYREWLSPAGGWEERDGQRRVLAAQELASERYGLMQEPYAIYRRLALNDPRLRMVLRDPRSLYVYDSDDRLLCWFLLDGKGSLVSWGNFYDGAINQHYYGPLVDVGDANLPKWGVSTTGAFRFEYVRADMQAEPAAEPS